MKKYKFTQCLPLKGVLNRAPEVSPDDAMFCGILESCAYLTVNTGNYSSHPGKRQTPKTLNLTPSELMKNAG